MSNPFADPQHGMDSDPFADQAVQNGMHSSGHEASYGNQDDYSPAVAAAASKSSQSGDMSTRLDDLTRRERELAAREAQLNAKVEHIRKHGRNNWPPGPFPLIYHDIDEEIPEQHRATTRTIYRIWMLLVLTLAVNLVACVLLLVSGSSNGGADLGAGIMYLPVIGSLSFLLWYLPLYKAMQTGYSFFFYFFFLFGFFHLCYSAYMLIGIPSSGSAGIINCISRWADGSIVAGVFCILATVGWGLQGLAFLWMYKQVIAWSRGQPGHSFASAKQELQMYGLKSFLFKTSTLPPQSQA